jgi:hypothetical protein
MFVDGMVGATMMLPRAGASPSPDLSATLCYLTISKPAPFWDRDHVFVRALVTEKHPSTGRQTLYVVEVSVKRSGKKPFASSGAESKMTIADALRSLNRVPAAEATPTLAR